MSGGSYDYVCWSDIAPAERLVGMRNRLRGLAPDHPAVRRTERIVALIEAAGELADERTREVWRAVEWHDSADYSRDQVFEALSDWHREPS